MLRPLSPIGRPMMYRGDEGKVLTYLPGTIITLMAFLKVLYYSSSVSGVNALEADPALKSSDAKSVRAKYT